MNIIHNRYNFVILYDVENGNPNGDPDAGNSPRIDPETGYGLVTSYCLKRKIRNYIGFLKEGEPGYDILVKTDKALNSKYTEAYDSCNLEKGKKGKNKDDVITARDFIMKNYYDTRIFGAVMSTGDDRCGNVTGPVQIYMSKSISPITILDISMIRQAKTTEARKEDSDIDFGRASIIPYALYRAEGSVDPIFAKKITGMTEEDLELLWIAIINMFEHDNSAMRGKMVVRALFVFKHDSFLGNAPSDSLFSKISVTEKNKDKPARAFADYEVIVDEKMPDGVTFIRKF